MMELHKRTGRMVTLALALATYLQALSCAAAGSREGLHLQEIELPPGFSISVYAENVENARSLCLGERGTLFV
jgi:hypothetical protein